jgi:hypothetical protein
MTQFPAVAVDRMRRIYALFPTLPAGDDEARRLLIRRCGEQIVYALGPRWGNKKRAGVSDLFRSKDAIAYMEDDGTCSVWDTQNGSTRALSVQAGSAPNYPHLPTNEATFMSLSPVDYLGNREPVPIQTPVPPPSLEPRVVVLEQLLAITQQHLGVLTAAVHVLEANTVHKPLPQYIGQIRLFGYGITVVSRPE